MSKSATTDFDWVAEWTSDPSPLRNAKAREKSRAFFLWSFRKTHNDCPESIVPARPVFFRRHDYGFRAPRRACHRATDFARARWLGPGTMHQRKQKRPRARGARSSGVADLTVAVSKRRWRYATHHRPLQSKL